MNIDHWREAWNLIEDRRNIDMNAEMVYELFFWPVTLVGTSLAWFITLAAIGVLVRLCRNPRVWQELVRK